MKKNISGRNKIKDKISHGLTKRRNAPLFDRVVSILEEARSNVVRAVNNNMVIAYWLIGREIVQEVQGGRREGGIRKTSYSGYFQPSDSKVWQGLFYYQFMVFQAIPSGFFGSYS